MYCSIDELKHKFELPLPGVSSQLKMAPKNRLEELSELSYRLPSAKKSAVMILLFPENGKLKTVLIQRSIYEGVHSGQISFPGGQYEVTDKTFDVTALRETYEEIGVEKDKIQIIGQLSDLFIPPSNFLVKVFVGYSNQKTSYIPDKKEVQSVIEVNIDDFYDSRNITEKDFYSSSLSLKVNAPCYLVNGLEIWGATAMIFSELLDVLKQSSTYSTFTNVSTHSN